jgi:hypothetical protein
MHDILLLLVFLYKYMHTDIIWIFEDFSCAVNFGKKYPSYRVGIVQKLILVQKRYFFPICTEVIQCIKYVDLITETKNMLQIKSSYSPSAFRHWDLELFSVLL